MRPPVPPVLPEAAQVCETLAQPAWTLGGDGDTRHVNAAWRRTTGLTLAASQAHGWLQAVHAEDRPRIADQVRRGQAAGTVVDAECRLQTTAGAYRWHQIQLQPIAGGPLWLGIASDIHDLKQTQVLLKAQTTVLEMVARGAPLAPTLSAIVTGIESLSDGVVGSILLLDGTRLRHGAAPHLPAAYTQAIDGAPIGPAAGSCGTAAYRRHRVIVRDIAHDPLWRDYANLALDHGLHACWSQPILDAAGRVLGTFAMYRTVPATPTAWDFTLIDSATHLAALAIARQRDDAERAALVTTLQQAVTARDEFLSLASHELKTPLTSLQLLVDRTRKRLSERPAGPWLNDDLAAINRQSQRLRLLDDRLLDFSRGLAGPVPLELGPVDGGRLVHEVLDRLADHAARSAAPLAADVPEGIVGHWDAHALEQIVTNLVSNALTFGAGKPVSVGLQADATHARLTVADQGIGIAEADQTRLFRRFERLVSSRHYGGFGLGLWLTRQLVTALGGTVTVASQPGAGAVFTVTLPLAGPGGPAVPSGSP